MTTRSRRRTGRKAASATELRRWAQKSFKGFSQSASWSRLAMATWEARSYYQAGFTAAEAAAWSKVCNLSSQACELLDAGFTLESVETWSAAGVPAEFIERVAKVFPVPAEAAVWRGRADWRSVSLQDLRACRLAPEEFDRWISAGVPASLVPTLSKALNLETFVAAMQSTGIRNYSLWCKVLGAGASPSQIEAALKAGWSQDDLCHWATTDLPFALWEEWRAIGIEPSSAKNLHEGGLDESSIARSWVSTGLSDDSIIAYRNLGCNPEQAKRYCIDGVGRQ